MQVTTLRGLGLPGDVPLFTPSASQQCPPQWSPSGSGCVANGTTSPVLSSADATASFNQWASSSNQMNAADTQRVLPQVLLTGGLALATLLFAPGGWKLLAVLPAGAAYVAWGLRGGL